LRLFNLYITLSLTWRHMPEYPQAWKPKISQEMLLAIWNYSALSNSECYICEFTVWNLLYILCLLYTMIMETKIQKLKNIL
jgi:hypothetical protein